MSINDLAILLLRLGIGLTFAAHGAQKAFGWWGGPGMERWHGAIGSMGFRPARLFAVVAMLAELVGGLLLAVGLLTPLAAAVLVAQSVVIILHVHAPKGFFNMQGGFEYPLALATGALAIGLIGAGAVSVDALLHLSYSPSIRSALIVLGIIAGFVSVALPHVATRQEPTARAS